jgi:chemotaxis protein MotB
MPKKFHTEIENFYVSYSDMVTLLLIMFIYFFSVSEIDPVKFEEVKSAMQSEIRGDGGGNGEQPLGATKQKPAKSKNVKSGDNGDMKSAIRTSLSAADIKHLEAEKEKLSGMQGEIETLIGKKGLGDKVAVEFTQGQLILKMGDAILFENGQAVLRPEARVVLGEIGVLFLKSDSHILIEGHTDDVPIKGGLYPSNWELSSARASSVVRFLEELGVNSDRFSVMGYNKFQPVVPNTSVKNRSQNRRVVLKLTANVPEKSTGKSNK